MRHGWVHMFITLRTTLTLQLHNFDLFRTCRTSSFCTVAWQLARFRLTRRIARSLGNSWVSCSISPLNLPDVNPMEHRVGGRDAGALLDITRQSRVTLPSWSVKIFVNDIMICHRSSSIYGNRVILQQTSIVCCGSWWIFWTLSSWHSSLKLLNC